MDPLLLGFKDGATERRYDEYMLHTTLWRLDYWFMTFSTPFVLSSTFGSLWQSLGPEQYSAPPATEVKLASLLNSLLLVLFWFVRWHGGVAGMLQWRTPLVIAFRICVSISLALSMRNFHWMYELQEHYLWAAFDALVINEVVGALVVGFGLRLKFRHHISTSFFSILALFAGKGNTFCEKITCSPEGHAFMLTERFADRCAGRVMGWLHHRLGKNSIMYRDKEPCLHLSVFIHLFFAFGMVSYFVWLAERRSRVKFAMRCNTQENHSDISSLRHISTATHIQHGGLFLISFGVIWEFLSMAGERFKHWGITEISVVNQIFDHGRANLS